MSHAIKELCKLTARAKDFATAGVGGVPTEQLIVAGALGMKDPCTGLKLNNNAYTIGRYFYCDDKTYRFKVKALLIGNIDRKIDTGRIKPITILLLINQALREFKHPFTQVNKLGEQEPVLSVSRYKVAKCIGISPNNYTNTHDEIYRETVRELHILSNQVISHLHSALK